jgi:hypothetical protein
MTYRTIDLAGRDYIWSPDSTRLLVRGQENRRRYLLVDVQNPGNPFEVPERPLDSGNSHGQAWLDMDRFIIADGNPATMKVISLTGPPVTVLEKAMEEGQASFSPDGKHFAITRSGFQVSDAYTSRLTFYRIEPFEMIATYDGFAMHERGAEAWSADGSRVVALRDPCSADETLIVLEIANGEETELAPVGTSQLVFSPDGSLIAFAASTPDSADLYIVPADGSEPPKAVFELPGAPAAVFHPQWSPDGRFVSFSLGGGDRCP